MHFDPTDGTTNNGGDAERATNPAGALARWALSKPDAVAFTFLARGEREEARLTFGDLDHRAAVVAERLRQHGFVGEPVLLIFPPGLDFVVALFACFISGAIAVPAPYLLPKRSMARIAAIQDDAGCRAVLTTKALASGPELIMGSLAGLSRIIVDRAGADSGDGEPSVPVAREGVALLQYTSGSTSAPKGVVITHANLRANQEMIASAFAIEASDRLVSWLPMFHDMGLVGAILQPVHTGTSAVLMSPLDFLQRPARWLRAISHYRATISGAPSFAYGLCARSVRADQLAGVDLSSWRLAFCGAEPVRALDTGFIRRRIRRRGIRISLLFSLLRAVRGHPLRFRRTCRGWSKKDR